jgi:methylmalonyl-CoA mutase
MIAAFKASGAKLACLCAADGMYARDGIDAVRALIAANARVYVAQPPANLETALRQAGVTDLIFPGCNALALLQAAHNFLATG